MWRFPEASSQTPYRCAECDTVIESTDSGGELIESFVGRSGGPVYRVVTVDGAEVHRCLSPFLMLSDMTAAHNAEAAWERISAARGIVAESVGCSIDEALHAMKARADDLGNSISDLAAGLIKGETFTT